MKIKINVAYEAASLCALLFLWVHTALAYTGLPDVVPVHFNAAGTADRYGGKGVVWTLPVLGLVIYGAGLFLYKRTGRLPQKDENNYKSPTDLQVRTARLFQTLRLFILLLLSCVNVRVVQSSPALDKWFLPVFFAALMLPTAVFVWQSVRR